MKKIVSLLVVLAMLIAMVPAVFAADNGSVTYDVTTMGWANSTAMTAWTSDVVTITPAAGGNSNVLRFYTSGNAIRMYPKNTVTVSVAEGYEIESVVVTTTTDGNAMTAEKTVVTNAKLAIQGNAVTLTADDKATSVSFGMNPELTSGNIRFTAIVVYYAKSGAAPCEHTNGYETHFDATSHWEKCVDCTYTTGNAAHDHVDGVCSCGHVAADEYVTSVDTSKTYKLCFYTNAEQYDWGTNYYATGELSGNYLAATTDIEAAADLHVEEADGGYYLYFLSGETKSYISLQSYENSSGNDSRKIVLVDNSADASVMTWNADVNTFVTTVVGTNEDDAECYMGTYGTYNTFSASKTSYITGSNAANVDVSQYPARLIDVTPAGEESTLPSGSFDAGYYDFYTWTAPENGNVTFTATGDNTFDMIASSQEPVALAANTHTLDVAKGTIYTFYSSEYDSTVTVSWAYNSVSESEGGEGGGNVETLVDGDNAVTLTEGQTATMTYTATRDGVLNITLGNQMGNIILVDADGNENFVTAGMAAFQQLVTLTINGTAYVYYTPITVAKDDEVTVVLGLPTGVAASLKANINVDVSEPPAAGSSLDNPIVIESLPWSVTQTADQDVYYTFTPDKDGVIEITYTAGWVSLVDSDWEKDETTGNYLVTVTAGVPISINPWGGDGTFTADWYVEGGEGGDTPNEGVTVDVKSETDGEYAFFEYIPDVNGTLSVTVSGNPGYEILCEDSNGDTLGLPKSGNTEQTVEYVLAAGVTYTVKIWCYDKSAWGQADGTVTYSYTFTPAEGGGETGNTNYEYADAITSTGEHTISMIENTNMTVVEFCPTETGVYKITSTADMAQVGMMWVNEEIWDDITNKVTTIEWTCTSVGQSIIIGFASDITLTVTKTGDYSDNEVSLQTYENKHTPSDFTLTDCWTVGDYVDVYDMTTTHTAVLGDDGYYHLDSADGAILLIDLDYMIKLTDALSGERPVMYAIVVDDDGEIVERWDIGEALQAYEACADENGYYPLTEDLIFFYQVYGDNQGYYDKDTTTLFVTTETSGTEGDTETPVVLFNPDSAWMFACLTATVEHTPANLYINFRDYVAATCLTDGSLVSVDYCTVCGEEVDSREEVLKATLQGHVYREDGVCALCGQEPLTLGDSDIVTDNCYSYVAEADGTLTITVVSGVYNHYALNEETGEYEFQYVMTIGPDGFLPTGMYFEYAGLQLLVNYASVVVDWEIDESGLLHVYDGENVCDGVYTIDVKAGDVVTVVVQNNLPDNYHDMELVLNLDLEVAEVPDDEDKTDDDKAPVTDGDDDKTDDDGKTDDDKAPVTDGDDDKTDDNGKTDDGKTPVTDGDDDKTDDDIPKTGDTIASVIAAAVVSAMSVVALPIIKKRF